MTGNDFVPSDQLNQLLPAWLRFSGEYRARWEGFDHLGFRDQNEDLFLLNRFRINMTIAPTPWLRLVTQGQDSRVFGKKPSTASTSYKDSLNLRLAFLEIGEMEKRPATLRVGRQELNFGDQRLVGSSNWGNVSRSFDAVRATMRLPGYRLDVFASSVVQPHDGQFAHHTQGNDLHGAYGSMDKLVPMGTVEPYIFWRLNPRVTAERGTPGKSDFYTTGLRWVGKLPLRFDYNTEMAYQFGSVSSDHVKAWAGHWQVGHTVDRYRWKPRLIAEYNYATGDRNPTDGRHGTFELLYPTPHNKYGLADQVGWKNIHHVRGAVEFKPRPKWMAIGQYHSWWLANPHDALYNAAGNPIARVAAGTAGRFVGRELDGEFIYTHSRHVQMAGGVGHIFPGTFLQKATPGRHFTFPYATVQYSF